MSSISSFAHRFCVSCVWAWTVAIALLQSTCACSSTSSGSSGLGLAGKLSTSDGGHLVALADRLFDEGDFSGAAAKYAEALADLVSDGSFDSGEPLRIQVQMIKCSARRTGPDGALAAIGALLTVIDCDALHRPDVALQLQDLCEWLSVEGYTTASAHLKSKLE